VSRIWLHKYNLKYKAVCLMGGLPLIFIFILYKHTQKPWQFRSWLITGFVTRLTRRVSLVEQELLSLPEHLSSQPVFSRDHVTRSLVLYVCFVNQCLSFFFWSLCCIFFFDIWILITPLVSLIYRFWLPLWYLWYTDSDYPFGIFDIQILITPLISLIYRFWLPLWYLWYTDSDYPFGIFDIQILITPLTS
jgi:hypothetical protein